MGMIGQSARRREDRRLLVGGGRFVDDLSLTGLVHAAFLRSRHAHALIQRLDLETARSKAGILAALGGEDVRPLGAIRGHLWTTIAPSIRAWLDPKLQPDDQRLLADGRVRYVGEPVAVVVATDRSLAEDALQEIEVDYEPLLGVFTAEQALEADAPLLNPEWGDNVSLHLAGTVGDPDGAFAASAARVALRARVHRQTGVPMETRGVVASFDRATGELTVWSNTQIPHVLRGVISEMLELPEHRVRVVAVDVGGGFGIKAVVYPEEVLVSLLARSLGRPVKWMESRMEHFTASIHSRDQVHDVELCCTADGTLLGVRDRFVVDIGAFNPLRLTSAANTVAHLVGPYRVPSIAVDGRVVVTNKMVSAPYRGAGRPEAVWAFERALDRLAREMGMDPVELRLRNTICRGEMPWDTGMLYRDGQRLVYDSGDFRTCLERAVEVLDVRSFRALQAERRARGTYVGLGVAAYVEGTGIGPFEAALVRVDGTGKVIAFTGACSQGQGHETVFAQICADALGATYEDVTVFGGDTAGLEYGWGTIASRSTVVAGNALANAARAVRAKALNVAAELLEVSPSDLVFENGELYVAGAPQRRVTLQAVARACAPQVALAAGREPGLEATEYFRPETVTYANGVHGAVVQVDPETGDVSILRYVVVHDCGRIVNPALAEGQIRGGVAQGIGGALLEELVYGEEGQLVTATFMDYAVPRAMDVPPIDVHHLESPSPRNPLGVKGLGEGGAIAPPAALANAIEDALQPFGVVITEVPITKARLWTLIHGRVGHPA